MAKQQVSGLLVIPTFIFIFICSLHSNVVFFYRDLLLSGYPRTEEFLKEIISLLVASHYRNSPDDLHILADCATQHLFVLLGPVLHTKGKAPALPTIFSVIQVRLVDNWVQLLPCTIPFLFMPFCIVCRI